MSIEATEVERIAKKLTEAEQERADIVAAIDGRLLRELRVYAKNTSNLNSDMAMGALINLVATRDAIERGEHLLKGQDHE